MTGPEPAGDPTIGTGLRRRQGRTSWRAVPIAPSAMLPRRAASDVSCGRLVANRRRFAATWFSPWP